jgi:hypothetical protein
MADHHDHLGGDQRVERALTLLRSRQWAGPNTNPLLERLFMKSIESERRERVRFRLVLGVAGALLGCGAVAAATRPAWRTAVFGPVARALNISESPAPVVAQAPAPADPVAQAPAPARAPQEILTAEPTQTGGGTSLSLADPGAEAPAGTVALGDSDVSFTTSGATLDMTDPSDGPCTPTYQQYVTDLGRRLMLGQPGAREKLFAALAHPGEVPSPQVAIGDLVFSRMKYELDRTQAEDVSNALALKYLALSGLEGVGAEGQGPEGGQVFELQLDAGDGNELWVQGQPVTIQLDGANQNGTFVFTAGGQDQAQLGAALKGAIRMLVTTKPPQDGQPAQGTPKK